MPSRIKNKAFPLPLPRPFFLLFSISRMLMFAISGALLSNKRLVIAWVALNRISTSIDLPQWQRQRHETFAFLCSSLVCVCVSLIVRTKHAPLLANKRVQSAQYWTEANNWFSPETAVICSSPRGLSSTQAPACKPMEC